MRKASQIVLLVAGILSVVAAVGLFLSALLYGIGGTLFVLLANGTIPTDGCPEGVFKFLEAIAGTRVASAAIISAMFTYTATYAVLAVLNIPAAALAFAAKGKNKTGLFIACIVLGVVSGNIVAVVGAVLGLVANGIENKQAEEAQPQEEPKAVEEKKEEAQAEEPKAEEAPKAEEPKEEAKAE